MLFKKLRGVINSTTLISDTFTDTDGTLIASHNPDIERVSGSYRTIQSSGTATNIQINTNRAIGTSTSTTTAACVIQTNVLNVIITCDVSKNNTTASGGGTGIAFRYTGSTGYIVDYFADNSQSGRQILRFARYNGTTLSNRIDVDFAHTTTAVYNMKVGLQGSDISVFVDNVLYLQTADNTYLGTEHGFSVLTNSTNKSYADNLLITSN